MGINGGSGGNGIGADFGVFELEFELELTDLTEAVEGGAC